MNNDESEKLSDEFATDIVTEYSVLFKKLGIKYAKHIPGEDFYKCFLQTIISHMHLQVVDKGYCIKIVSEAMEDALEIQMIPIKVSE